MRLKWSELRRKEQLERESDTQFAFYGSGICRTFIRPPSDEVPRDRCWFCLELESEHHKADEVQK